MLFHNIALATRIGDITVEEMLEIGFPVLIGVMVVALIFWAIAKNRRDTLDAEQPVKEANAKVVDVQQLPPNAIAFERWVIFETESGERVRLLVKVSELYIAGDEGHLKWQGSKLYFFNRGQRAPQKTVMNADRIYANGACSGQPQGKIPAWKLVEQEKRGDAAPVDVQWNMVLQDKSDSIRCKYCAHFEPGVNRCHLYHDFDQSLDKRGGDYFKETAPDDRCSNFQLTAMDAMAQGVTEKRADGSYIVGLSDVPGLKLSLINAHK